MHDFPETHETHGFFERTDLSPAWTPDDGGPQAWEVTITELDRNASRTLHRVSKEGAVAVQLARRSRRRFGSAIQHGRIDRGRWPRGRDR